MIITERLILTPPVLADFEESYATTADPDTVAFITGKPITREESWSRTLRNIGHWTAFTYGIFTIREKNTGAYIGETGLAHFARGLGEHFDPAPEAAWVLNKSAHGRGYATEAVRAAHDWHMAHKPTKRTVCIIDPQNTASLRVAKKLGYRTFGQTEYRAKPVLMLERLA